MDDTTKEPSLESESAAMQQQLYRLGRLYTKVMQLARRIQKSRARLASGRLVEIRVGLTLAEAERRLIDSTLLSCDGNKTQAAQILGLSRGGLHNRMKRFGRSSVK